MSKPLFSLGKMLMTPAAAKILQAAHVAPFELFARHQRGDFGITSAGDKKLNLKSIKDGSRIISAYEINGEKLWVITDGTDDAGVRASTCILTPDEY